MESTPAPTRVLESPTTTNLRQPPLDRQVIPAASPLPTPSKKRKSKLPAEPVGPYLKKPKCDHPAVQIKPSPAKCKREVFPSQVKLPPHLIQWDLEDREPATRRERYLKRAQESRRETARIRLAALDAEKERRRKFHEPKDRFYADRLMKIWYDAVPEAMRDRDAAIDGGQDADC